MHSQVLNNLKGDGLSDKTSRNQISRNFKVTRYSLRVTWCFEIIEAPVKFQNNTLIQTTDLAWTGYTCRWCPIKALFALSIAGHRTHKELCMFCTFVIFLVSLHRYLWVYLKIKNNTTWKPPKSTVSAQVKVFFSVSSKYYWHFLSCR